MLTLKFTWLQGSYQQGGKHKTRNYSLQKFTPNIGRTHSYTNTVLIK